MLPNAYLTSYSRMSGSRWVISLSPLGLHHDYLGQSYYRDYLGREALFLYRSSVYSCHLFLLRSAFVRSKPFLFFIVPIFAWNVPLVYLIFFKRSLVFPTLLFSSISLHWSLRKLFLSVLTILWNSAFKCVSLSFLLCLQLLFFSQLFLRLPQTTILPFCISFCWEMCWSLPPVQCHKPLSIVLQALYQI